MSFIDQLAMWCGYTFMLVCAAFALAWAWETVMRNLWKRCIDSDDFLKVVIAYAKERRRKREKNRVGPADE